MSRQAGLVRSPATFLPAVGIVLAAGLAFFLTAERTRGEEPAGLLSSPYPPSTLLRAGTTELEFTVVSAQPARCRYSIGTPAVFEQMTELDDGQDSTSHRTILRGLSPDTNTVNDVYVRSSSQPDYALHLQYRCLPNANPPYPRTGNLWGSWWLVPKGLEYCARTDLLLGAELTPAQIRTLRQLNPHILILTSINAVENSNLPDDYYLKDTQGRRIEVWPGSYRLNLTKPYVAEYQAHYACQLILDSGLSYDGCFFDNFFTSQSWLQSDIYGNTVHLDANEDGKEDDPAWLDSAWRAGVYHELETWRALMPWALASGHLPRPPEQECTAIFNGDSLGFMTAEVLEGLQPFQSLWGTYSSWRRLGRIPGITMVESSPQRQISYGYGFDPMSAIPPATLEFARTYYPSMRFGLAMTLMSDGYFAHEFGDTYHGNDWRYDELEFKLGYPRRSAVRIPARDFRSDEHIVNGAFDEPLEGTWQLWANAEDGAVASMTRAEGEGAGGRASAKIYVSAAGQAVDWHVNLYQAGRSLVQGVEYDFTFTARSDAPRTITVSAQKGNPDWRGYGLWEQVAVGTGWDRYLVSFIASETVSDARLQFFLGSTAGVVWIDDVSLMEHPPDIFRRDFGNGVVLLNASRQPRTVFVGAGLSRIKGDQAPRHQYIIDDTGPAFSFTGAWREAFYDSGQWKAAGPFFHNWGAGCHQLDGTDGQARWDLSLPEDDLYTIEAWWPAAPGSTAWSTRVVYEVAAGGAVLASATLDQSGGGDQWHTIASVPLAASGAPEVRIRNEGIGSAIADALHVRSAARYNDGSRAVDVKLAPMDGIILRRTPSTRR
jgi:hypothetical protein